MKSRKLILSVLISSIVSFVAVCFSTFSYAGNDQQLLSNELKNMDLDRFVQQRGVSEAIDSMRNVTTQRRGESTGPLTATSLKTFSGDSLEICNGILAFGIRDESDNYSKKEKYQLTKAAVCTESFNTLAKAKNAGDSLGLDIFGVLGFSASGSYDEKTYQEAWTKFCSSDYSEISSNDEYYSHIATASTVIANAWSSCVNSLADRFISYVQPSADRTRFSVFMENKGSGDRRFTVKKVTIVPNSGVNCSDLPRLPFTTTGNYTSFVCTKPSEKELTLSVETSVDPIRPMTVPSRTEVPISLDARLAKIETAIRSSTVIGSIMAFSGTKQEAEALKANGWWICDRRKIEDATSLLNGQYTPDLTNKFVMGFSDSGKTGGNSSISISDQTIDSYTVAPGFGGSTFIGDPRAGVWSALTWINETPLHSQGKWSGGTFSTIPPFYSVIYLIRVR